MICEMSPESIAGKLEEVLNDEQLLTFLKKNAESFQYDNDSIIRQFYKIIQ